MREADTGVLHFPATCHGRHPLCSSWPLCSHQLLVLLHLHLMSPRPPASLTEPGLVSSERCRGALEYHEAPSPSIFFKDLVLERYEFVAASCFTEVFRNILRDCSGSVEISRHSIQTDFVWKDS